MERSELMQIAAELDSSLPNFFGTIYKKYQSTIKKWISEQYEISCNSNLVYQFINKHKLSLINEEYNDFLKTASLEQLYWMSCILERIDTNSFLSDNADENYAFYDEFDKQSFSNIVKMFKDYVFRSGGTDYFENMKPETTPYKRFDHIDAEEEEDEPLDFSYNKTCWGKDVNDKIIKEFFFDETALHNINHDISVKTEGLYKALLNKDFNPQLSEIWAEDYVELIGYALEGKYKVNGEVVILDEIEETEDDCSNDKEIVFAHAISNESMFIHFNNWRHKKSEEALKSFLTVIHRNLLYIINKNDEIDYKAITNREITEKIVSLIYREIEECKGNFFRLDYLPGFDVYAYAAFRESYGEPHYIETQRLIYNHLKENKESRLLDWYVNEYMSLKMYELAWGVKAYCNDRADLDDFISEFDSNKDKIKSLEKEINKIHELGLIQQSLFFLYDAIIAGSNDELKGTGVRKLINVLEDMIFRDEKVAEDIDEELKRVSSKSLDNNNLEFLNKIKSEILITLSSMFNDVPYNEEGLIKISEIKNSVLRKLNNYGFAKNEGEITNKVIENIETFSIKLLEFLKKDDRGVLISRISDFQTDFIKKYDLSISSDDLLKFLPKPNRDMVNNFLLTSELVFRTLSNREDKDELDFSPAIISLTKAMELIMNWAFVQMKFKPDDIDRESVRYYFDKDDNKNSVEFGPCINLLKDSMRINAGDLGFSWGDKFRSDGVAIESRFKKINKNSSGKSVYDFDRLNRFRGLKIRINKKIANDIFETEVCFNEDIEQNRLMFIKGLEYIKDNYRNKVAHKDGIMLDAATDCRNLLMQSQNLLWIMMYLLI